jgi:hypothetical protein
MSLEIENKEKMIQSCQAILESCEKPFVWEDEDTYQYHDFKKPFNLFQLHQEIDSELHNLFEKFSNTTNLYDQIKATCILNEEWFEYGTYGLDRDFTRYFHKFTLKPEYVEQVKTYFNNRLGELQKDS